MIWESAKDQDETTPGFDEDDVKDPTVYIIINKSIFQNSYNVQEIHCNTHDVKFDENNTVIRAEPGYGKDQTDLVL